jgi:hypothetical protein
MSRKLAMTKMKVIGVLVVLVLCAVVVGFYRGWFSLSTHGRGTESNKVTLTVDSDKVKDDAEKVEDKTTELAGKASDEAKELGDQARDRVENK